MIRRLRDVALVFLALGLMPVAAHAELTVYRLRFLDGDHSAVISGVAAETTRWQTCYNGRVSAIFIQTWVPVGTADSARVKIDYQTIATTDTLLKISEVDTVTSTLIGHPVDTVGAERGFVKRYYPEPCWWVRFIVGGMGSNSDSTRVGNMRLILDDLR